MHDCSPLTVALCLCGQLRTASPKDLLMHWRQQARFARSLMGTKPWAGLHIFVAVVGSSSEIEATFAALASSWGLPPGNVHAVPHDQNTLPATLVQRACGSTTSERTVEDFCMRLIDASDYKRSRNARQAWCKQTLLTNLLRYYAQWETMTSCCRHVETVERGCGRHFDWVVKMRPDWPFEATTTTIPDMERADVPSDEVVAAATPMEQRRTGPFALHARLRCSPQALDEHRMATSVHHVGAINNGCGRNTTIVDDSFLVARRAASATVCSAASLPCPLTDSETASAVLRWCHPKQAVMAECLLTVAALRAGVRDFAPMAITWSPHPPCPARYAAQQNRSTPFDPSSCKWSPHLLRSRQGNRSHWNWAWPRAPMPSMPPSPTPPAVLHV